MDIILYKVALAYLPLSLLAENVICSGDQSLI